MTIIRHIIRFIVAAVVLLIVSWVLPNFDIYGFWTALLAALVIALIGWGIEALFGERISPYSRGFIGFLVSAVVIYCTQFIIADFQSTFIGSLLAAAIIGIVDRFVPVKPQFGDTEKVQDS